MSTRQLNKVEPYRCAKCNRNQISEGRCDKSHWTEQNNRMIQPVQNYNEISLVWQSMQMLWFGYWNHLKHIEFILLLFGINQTQFDFWEFRLSSLHVVMKKCFENLREYPQFKFATARSLCRFGILNALEITSHNTELKLRQKCHRFTADDFYFCYKVLCLENHGKCSKCDATGMTIFPTFFFSSSEFNVPMKNIFFSFLCEKMKQLATVVT